MLPPHVRLSSRLPRVRWEPPTLGLPSFTGCRWHRSHSQLSALLHTLLLCLSHYPFLPCLSLLLLLFMLRPFFNAAVLPSRASTNIDVDALEAQLSILPNQHFVNALINGLRYGFHIGFSSPRFSVCAPNRPSALEHREVVSAAIAKGVERGHTVGPFPTPPFPVFACSPLGCVPKKPDSWRLILDLSAPAGCSVNDGIPVENGAVQYVRFDQIIRMIAQLGRGALIAKVDLKHAFRQCPVHPDDWPLLCYKWEDQYYVDVRLPFGLRSSPALFNKLAEGLCCLLRTKGISHLEHYLDDFITAGPPDSPICLAHQQLILRTFDQVGVLASPDKTLGPVPAYLCWASKSTLWPGRLACRPRRLRNTHRFSRPGAFVHPPPNGSWIL